MSDFSLFPSDEEEVELTQLSDLEGTQASADTSDLLANGSDKQPKEKYAMLGTVGSGAMGEILLLRDQELRRKVAYKKIHASMSSNRKVMDRFFTEAQITAQLDHPNIVPIYSLEISNQGEIGYAMKLIQGKTLKALMHEARQQYDQQGQVDESHNLLALLEHFLKVCDAMNYSHIKGVIHRDLKPANIMVGRYNEVYVMDWGIAKVVRQNEVPVDDEVVQLIHSDAHEPPMERTQLGQILGTPRYMSPQQAAGKNDELDARCDQFALGLILFEIITLKPALKGNNQIDLLKKVLKAELEPFLHYHSKTPIAVELQAIVRKATALKTDQRYASVTALADDLRRFLRGEAVLAKPDTSLQKVLRWVGRHRQTALGLILGLFVLSSGTVIWSLYQQQQAMIQARVHEKTLSAFLINVAKRAQLIDSQFTGFEAMLARLAGVAVQLLEFGEPSRDPVFSYLDFFTPAKAPPDLTYSSFYKGPISTDWASFKLSPGISQSQLEPLMRTINPLRHTFRYIALQSESPAATLLPAKQARSLLLEKGVPLIWAYLGLKEGLLINYPGNTGYNPAYDARKRPWYSLSLEQKGPHWKPPYIDASGTGWVLPCTLPLRDSKGEFLGVAGVEMTLDFIKSQYLEITALSGILNSYILDQQGRVVASTQEKSEKFAKGILVDKARELKPYPHPEVLSQLLKNKSGYFEDKTRKGGLVLAYYPIHSLGWYYLVEAETQKLNMD
jgi:eukaryotic-like serine/threonine-protein kinase